MKAFKIIRDTILVLFLIISIVVIVGAVMGWSTFPIMTGNTSISPGSLIINDANYQQIAVIPLLGYVVYYCWSLIGKIVLGVITLALISTFFFMKDKKAEVQAETAEEVQAVPVKENNTEENMFKFKDDFNPIIEPFIIPHIISLLSLFIITLFK